MFKKIIITLIAIVMLVVIGAVLFVNLSYEKDYSEGHPVSVLKIEGDSAMIAHGKYLAHGPAHCSHCHAPMSEFAKMESGEDVSLVGGFGLEIPPGTFYAPNITSDKESGIGNLTDGELYRMMRYNVNHKGQAVFDFMPFINMSEEDIYSIIAYLRTLEPVKIDSKHSEYSLLGKVILASGGIMPGVPDQPVLEFIEKEVSIEYGKYLAYAVANCRGCHTNRDMKTGEYIGEEYAGGLQFGPDNLTQGDAFVTPNLTPDSKTGIMTNWNEEEFVTRMKGGRIHDFSPMPWGAFRQMEDDDLRAIYMFLMDLDPIQNDVGEVYTPAET
jgi:mono/diheme cytochrome c family protein